MPVMIARDWSGRKPSCQHIGCEGLERDLAAAVSCLYDDKIFDFATVVDSPYPSFVVLNRMSCSRIIRVNAI